jgi:hypothetical protein
VILACANALQTLCYTTLSSASRAEIDEPELILSDVLFAQDSSNTRAETAQEKLRGLFTSLTEAIAKASSKGERRRQSMRQREEETLQIKALQDANAELKEQLRG